MSQEARSLFFRQDGGQASGWFDAQGIDGSHVPVEHPTVEEGRAPGAWFWVEAAPCSCTAQWGRQAATAVASIVLRCCGWWKEAKSCNPANVGLVGANSLVFTTQRIAHPVQQFLDVNRGCTVALLTKAIPALRL